MRLLEVFVSCVDSVPLGFTGRKLCGGIAIADFSVLANRNRTIYIIHITNCLCKAIAIAASAQRETKRILGVVILYIRRLLFLQVVVIDAKYWRIAKLIDLFKHNFSHAGVDATDQSFSPIPLPIWNLYLCGRLGTKPKVMGSLMVIATIRAGYNCKVKINFSQTLHALKNISFLKHVCNEMSTISKQNTCPFR